MRHAATCKTMYAMPFFGKAIMESQFPSAMYIGFLSVDTVRGQNTIKCLQRTHIFAFLRKNAQKGLTIRIIVCIITEVYS